jgi:glycosyltransferase involved in cell wall biosynthesis
MLRILAIEPYYGGSHQVFLDGYRAHSRHEIELLTMPARKWKWRMRGAALSLQEEVLARAADFDALFVTDYLDLAALAGMRPSLPPGLRRVVYFHENQLTYPLQDEEERDYQFGFTNITSCLAADRVIFNSHYHMHNFLEGVEKLIARMPDEHPTGLPETIQDRAVVVPVGVDLTEFDTHRNRGAGRGGPLTILWNHRWEYDKGAAMFFGLMMELQAEGHEFDLVVTGQRFREAPPIFDQAWERLMPRMKNFGFVESRVEYCGLVNDSDIVVSTAMHEFFGIAIVEAIYSGCLPLLPNRLSYPELIPHEHHETCLYEDRDDLKQRLVHWLRHADEARAFDIGPEMRRFGWEEVAPQLDSVMEQACEERVDG